MSPLDHQAPETEPAMPREQLNGSGNGHGGSAPENSSASSRSRYWRSLEEHADSPEFRASMAREFPAGATEMLEPATRRDFLKLMGGSLALAGIGLTGCRWPKEKILPSSYQVPGTNTGHTKQFATSMDLGGVGTGLLVTSYDGRPIKIEGNPSHQYSGGRTTAWQQAAILDMYDPDRSRGPVKRGADSATDVTAEEFRAAFAALLGAHAVTGGAGLAVLSEANSGHTLADMRQRFSERFPLAAWHEYEPLSPDNEREGSFVAFGKALRPIHDFSKAKVVVAIDSDFLMFHPASLKYTRDFVSSRKPDSDGFSRLYSFETNYTVTGAQADHRQALSPGEIGTVACILGADLFVQQGIPLPADYQGLLGTLNGYVGHPMREYPAVKAMLDDLRSKRGASIIIAGPQQPPEIHALVHMCNLALGNVGQTVSYIEDPDQQRQTHLKALARLRQDIESGSISTLLMIGGNPVFDAPLEMGFGELLRSVQNSVHLSVYDNETSQASTWHVNRAHFLESWGDTRAWDGSISVIQPLIAPLYDGISEIELLSMAVESTPLTGYELVRRALGPVLDAADFEAAWRQSLHDGVVSNSAAAAVNPTFVQSNFAYFFEQYLSPQAPAADEIEVLFAPSYSIYDGRFANNGWLLENPDPMTKCTWDNPVLMSTVTAEMFQLKHGDVARITLNDQQLDLPVYILPGHGAHAVTVTLGYGRSAAIREVNRGGWNTYRIRSRESFYRASGAKLARTGQTFELASVQDHWAIDKIGLEERGRRVAELVREGTVEQNASDPGFVAALGEPVENDGHWDQLWKDPVAYDQQTYRWAMAIDLNKCTGCGICTVACQAENNIPVVGRKLVRKGREMHWIRIDRYFTGDPVDAMAVAQPVPCQHCENAPCEQVCPVAATVHDHDGLNVMVYNRCVGTRYCSNNCPYKVRRFNWFNLHKNRGEMTQVEMMAMNPDVTVRSRGVMEKCSFCTQRIQAAKIDAKNNGRAVADGEVTPACAQACPADAILFGNLNDPESRIRTEFESKRGYSILGEINTRPRVRYQARLRNPHPALAESYPVGHGGHGHGDLVDIQHDTHSEESGQDHAEAVGATSGGGH